MEPLGRIGRTTVDVLAVLLESDRPRWGLEVIKATGRPSGSVYPLLDRLERAGHVRRLPRTDDRRRVDVLVQDSAKELGWAFFGPLIDATAAVLDRRSAAERAVIDAFLDDMVAAVQALDAAGDD